MNYSQRYPAIDQTSFVNNYYWQYPYQNGPAYYPIYPNSKSYWPERFSNHIYYQAENYNGAQRVQNDVDITVFNKSLIAYKQLLREASMVLNHLADSKQFASQVMGAAQVSNTTEVERLLHSIGIKSKFTVTYNPDGIHMKFWSDVQGTECCHLDMAIRWR